MDKTNIWGTVCRLIEGDFNIKKAYPESTGYREVIENYSCIALLCGVNMVKYLLQKGLPL